MPREEYLVSDLVEMIRSGAAPSLESCNDPVEMGRTFGGAVRSLYRTYKDVPNMIVAGRLGVRYCLEQAALAPDAAMSRDLKMRAQAIAFNTAANCWPGWGDDGIVIEPQQIQAGLELAAEHRRIVQELEMRPREEGGAFWLTGALQLAAGRSEAACVAFAQAEETFLADETCSAHALMARGYIALARNDQTSLRETLERLRAGGSKDALFFADQLTTAQRILIGK